MWCIAVILLIVIAVIGIFPFIRSGQISRGRGE